MRRVIGTIGATLAVVAVIAVSAAPASDAGQDPGWSNYNPPDWSAQLLPYIEQDNLFRAMSAAAAPAGALEGRHTSGVNIGMGDGSVRFIRDSALSMSTWRALGTRSGGEVLSSDW